MAAGLGFKTFNTGDVLSAADTNGYLMQGVLVFADATARTAAITSPEEGQVSFLKDTNSTEYYDGSAWVAIGGGSSPLTTKGDLYTYSTTDARLAVGADGTTLVSDSTEATGLKWATAASSGGMTLISSTSLTGASVTISSIPQTYISLQLRLIQCDSASNPRTFRIRYNGDSGSHYFSDRLNETSHSFSQDGINALVNNYSGGDVSFAVLDIFNYTSDKSWKIGYSVGVAQNKDTLANSNISSGVTGWNQDADAITSITITTTGGGNIDGTAVLYGVK